MAPNYVPKIFALLRNDIGLEIKDDLKSLTRRVKEINHKEGFIFKA